MLRIWPIVAAVLTLSSPAWAQADFATKARFAVLMDEQSGTVIFQNATQAVAPRSLAASSRRRSIFARLEYSGRIMKGR